MPIKTGAKMFHILISFSSLQNPAQVEQQILLKMDDNLLHYFDPIGIKPGRFSAKEINPAGHPVPKSLPSKTD
jgi:hypothetical protein